jgi:Pyruvate/2-oxoacid:ferredoxin oxidoreductase delta subunit
MRISDCIACGQCVEFIMGAHCPTLALQLHTTSGYAGPIIDQDKCTGCGKCKEEIDCLNDSFEED